MKNQILLGVNVDHVATIRQARGVSYPDPVSCALLAEQHGADGITVHLREDHRHIQPRDVRILKEVLQTRLNLEMAATERMMAYACEIKPQFCCLVPEKREELTTEGGLDVMHRFNEIKKACDLLAHCNIQVSLFIDPDPKQIHAAKETGAPWIELHTGKYANEMSETKRSEHLNELKKGAEMANEIGLKVNAGHGLHYHNVQPVAAIPEIIELNIGHAIVSHAIMVGFPKAVEQMKSLMRQARNL